MHLNESTMLTASLKITKTYSMFALFRDAGYTGPKCVVNDSPIGTTISIFKRPCDYKPTGWCIRQFKPMLTCNHLQCIVSISFFDLIFSFLDYIEHMLFVFSFERFSTFELPISASFFGYIQFTAYVLFSSFCKQCLLMIITLFLPPQHTSLQYHTLRWRL